MNRKQIRIDYLMSNSAITGKLREFRLLSKN